MKYFVSMPNTAAGPGAPALLETSFVTSQFANFTDAMETAQAMVSTDGTRITVVTAEALDWLHTSAWLDPDGVAESGDEMDLNRMRISADEDFIHVFELPSGTASSTDTLALHYHSRPHGRCTCVDDPDCPGGGRCVGGVCQAGHTCDEDLQCPATGACDRGGPVVRRDGWVVSELKTLVLEVEP